jgi:hypothetical protein
MALAAMWRPALTLAVGLICVVGLGITLFSSGVSPPPAPNQSMIGSNIESKLGVAGTLLKATLSELDMCPNLWKAVRKAEKRLEAEISKVMQSADECAEDTTSKGCTEMLVEKAQKVLTKEMKLVMPKEEPKEEGDATDDDGGKKLKSMFTPAVIALIEDLTVLLARDTIENIQKDLPQPTKPTEAVEKFEDKMEGKLGKQLEKFCPETEEKWEDLSDSGLKEILEKNEVSADMKATLTRLWLRNAHAHHQEQKLRSAILELAQHSVTHEQLAQARAYELSNHVAHEKQCFVMLWCGFLALVVLFAIDKVRPPRSANLVEEWDEELPNQSGAFAANPRSIRCPTYSCAETVSADYDRVPGEHDSMTKACL